MVSSTVATLRGMFGRPRRWSRLLLFAAVLAIALSVLAMHQLAVDHALAAAGQRRRNRLALSCLHTAEEFAGFSRWYVEA